jgi:hypothetical protein
VKLESLGTHFDMVGRGARLGVSLGERDPNNLPPVVPRMVFAGGRSFFSTDSFYINGTLPTQHVTTKSRNGSFRFAINEASHHAIL